MLATQTRANLATNSRASRRRAIWKRVKKKERGNVMAEAVLAGEEIEEFACEAGVCSFWLLSLQNSRGSRKTSSWVTVQETQAMGRASRTR